MNHKYRFQLLDKIRDVILIGDEDTSMKTSLFKWLGMRRIYLIKMYLNFKDNCFFSSSIEHDYLDQFRCTQHVVMRGIIRDDMAIFIISHCPCLVSIVISGKYYGNQTTDHTLLSIAEYCTGRLQSISLRNCYNITNAGLIAISMRCLHLLSLKVHDCFQIADTSIISISTHCTGLKSLNLQGCYKITDASIISISTYCTGLKSLYLHGCDQIRDVSIISISTYCTGLMLLNLYNCSHITDTSIEHHINIYSLHWTTIAKSKMLLSDICCKHHIIIYSLY